MERPPLGVGGWTALAGVVLTALVLLGASSLRGTGRVYCTGNRPPHPTPMAKLLRTIKPSAGTPTVSRAKIAEAVRRVAASTAHRDVAPAAKAAALRQPSVIVAPTSTADAAAGSGKAKSRSARAVR